MPAGKICRSPIILTNQTQVVVAKSLTTATNELPSLAQVFDTMHVEVLRSSTTILDTGELRMCDLHSRKFLLFTNDNQLVLWLAGYQPGKTNRT